MRKAKATYYAPEGDNPVVTMNDQRFIDGQAVDLNTNDHGRLIEKLQTNPHFEVELGEEVKGEEKRGPGRPKKSREDVAKAEKDYADRENAMRNQGGFRPGSDYQGGPFPGGITTGMPGMAPLAEGSEGNNVSGTITSDVKPGSKPDAKQAAPHKK